MTFRIILTVWFAIEPSSDVRKGYRDDDGWYVFLGLIWNSLFIYGVWNWI